jgi:hypothetical protein
MTEIRGEPISQDEVAVTQGLAGPFVTGGLLLLLWRPRDVHPWKEGIGVVVKECRSLDALTEALQITASLSLMHDVSVLDVEPFYKSKYDPSKEQKDELEELVLRAICAKCPTVILGITLLKSKAPYCIPSIAVNHTTNRSS